MTADIAPRPGRSSPLVRQCVACRVLLSSATAPGIMMLLENHTAWHQGGSSRITLDDRQDGAPTVPSGAADDCRS
jgi:hypothetical protein